MTVQEIKREIAHSDAYITVLKKSLEQFGLKDTDIVEVNKAIDSSKEYILSLVRAYNAKR